MCRPGTWRLSVRRGNTKVRAGRNHLPLSHPDCRWLLILIVALHPCVLQPQLPGPVRPPVWQVPRLRRRPATTTRVVRPDGCERNLDRRSGGAWDALGQGRQRSRPSTEVTKATDHHRLQPDHGRQARCGLRRFLRSGEWPTAQDRWPPAFPRFGCLRFGGRQISEGA